MTDASRIRFEVRVLGATAEEILHFEEVLPKGVTTPRVGQLGGPFDTTTPWRRIIAVEPYPGDLALIWLEPIDVSNSERSFDAEVAALRAEGWRT